MTDDPDNNGLAAELALGTLDREERNAAQDLYDRDRAFREEVDAWGARLAPLLETGADVVPLVDLLPGIVGRLGPVPGLAGSNTNHEIGLLRGRLSTWRRATAATASLAAVLALWIAVDRPRRPPEHPATYMAVLQQGGNSPAFLVSLDIRTHRMTIVPAGATEERDKSYELWMIDSSNAPKSLGVIDATVAAHREIPSGDTIGITKATYAVTLEPLGGSPTGQPTSTPLFVGHLLEASSGT